MSSSQRGGWESWSGITPSWIRNCCLAWVFLKHVFNFFLCLRQRSVLIENRKIPSVLVGKIPPETFLAARQYQKALLYFEMVSCAYYLVIETIILYTVTYTQFWMQSGPLLDRLGIWPETWDYEMGESCVFITITVFFENSIPVPLQLYKTFVIEQKYGFNKMSLFTFFRENMEMMAMQSVWASVACCCILFIIRVTGYVFVVWVWLFCSFWLLMTLGIYPNVIAPYFQ
ncbi:CAAX prenyl protease 1 [Orchesella cincta]|uniref:CAAX prenyl protease 1 n=1 Tax=Orchesella cincta TaxID=48709 RepID=A0A1D2MEQ8_ORCCI|nr:CAAX prenyl protease 1 [Orchesella cincta]